jgi:AraC family transcriptional regulator of adaptative response / DNA-3-methyladenine glycosylase II
LEISLESEGAWCRVHGEHKLGRESMVFLHTVALKMLGLNNEVSLFETRMARTPRTAAMVTRQKGLRLPCIPTNFDGLCWAIIGQQINVKFAGSLRREIIQLAGEKVGEMIAHPTPERVADIGATALTKRRYSRSKAEYLMNAAEAVAKGELDAEGLPDGSAVAAEKKLTALRGVGTWTARYFMLRGGFADAAPVGDSALATALQKLHNRAERPEHDEVHKMMLDFAPHRSLATMHLWTSLKEVA